MPRLKHKGCGGVLVHIKQVSIGFYDAPRIHG